MTKRIRSRSFKKRSRLRKNTFKRKNTRKSIIKKSSRRKYRKHKTYRRKKTKGGGPGVSAMQPGSGAAPGPDPPLSPEAVEDLRQRQAAGRLPPITFFWAGSWLGKMWYALRVIQRGDTGRHGGDMNYTWITKEGIVELSKKLGLGDITISLSAIENQAKNPRDDSGNPIVHEGVGISKSETILDKIDIRLMYLNNHFEGLHKLIRRHAITHLIDDSYLDDFDKTSHTGVKAMKSLQIGRN